MRSIASIMSVKRGVSERSLKHADRCCFYRRPQGFVQAVPRHDVGLSAKDAGGVFLNIHQFKDSELTSLIVEKQVNIGIVIRFSARRRAEHVKTFDAKPFQIGFVLLQSAYGFIAFHGNIIANPGGCFHVFRFRRTSSVTTLE